MSLVHPLCPRAERTRGTAVLSRRILRTIRGAWIAAALALLIFVPPSCHAQRGGGNMQQGQIRERVRGLIAAIDARREDGYDVTRAEALLDDLRAALAHHDRAEAQRLGQEIRSRLDNAPRQGTGIPLPPSELWTRLTPGDVPGTWGRADVRFGLLDCYMNTDPATAQGLVRGLGVQWVRLSAPLSGGLNWGSVEREKGRYTWGRSDSVMAQARAARVEPMITFGITNQWDAINNGRTRATARQLPGDLAAYSAFVRAAVSRYKSSVHVWQVWNEPDDTGHWADTPAHYADLVIATSEAIRAADPTARVALAGIYKREFLDAVIQRLVAQRPDRSVVDALDIHVFGAVRNGGPELQNFHKTYRDLGDVVTMYRDVTRGTAYATTPLWVSETATYSDTPSEIWPAQSERDQARDLVRRFAFAFGQGVRRVGWASLVEWTTWQGKDVNFNHVGLVRNPANGHGKAPKLAYYTYKRLIEQLGDFTAVSRLDAPDWVTALRFSTPRGPVIVAWYDRWAGGCPPTITARLAAPDGVTATVGRAVPASTPGKHSTAAFAHSTVPVRDHAVTLTLDDDPVFVTFGH